MNEALLCRGSGTRAIAPLAPRHYAEQILSQPLRWEDESITLQTGYGRDQP